VVRPAGLYRNGDDRALCRAGREGAPMSPERKPSKDDMRKGGMVAMAVLVFLAVFTTLFVMMG